MRLLLALLGSLLAVGSGRAQEQDFSKVEVKATLVAGNIYMLQGAGGNIAAVAAHRQGGAKRVEPCGVRGRCDAPSSATFPTSASRTRSRIAASGISGSSAAEGRTRAMRATPKYSST